MESMVTSLLAGRKRSSAPARCRISRKRSDSASARDKSGGAVKLRRCHCSSITCWLTNASRACLTSTFFRPATSLHTRHVALGDTADEVFCDIPGFPRNRYGDQRRAFPGFDGTEVRLKTQSAGAIECCAFKQPGGRNIRGQAPELCQLAEQVEVRHAREAVGAQRHRNAGAVELRHRR